MSRARQDDDLSDEIRRTMEEADAALAALESEQDEPDPCEPTEADRLLLRDLCERMGPEHVLDAALAAWRERLRATTLQPSMIIGSWLRSCIDRVDEKKPPTSVVLLQRPVSDLTLGTRAHNALCNLRIETIGQLLLWSSRELHNARHVGKATVAEIEAALDKIGLKLKSARRIP